MPNWCSNSFAIYGDAFAVLRLKMILDDAVKEEPQMFKSHASDFGTGWHGNLLLAAGYSEKDVMERDDLPCRGSILDVEYFEDGPYGPYIRIQTETAWGPNPEMWDTLIADKFDGQLQYVYIAEECGCEIYTNTDEEGEIFPDRYYVEVSEDGDEFESEYFTNQADAKAWLESWVGHEFESWDDLDAHIGEIAEEKFGEDCCCNIHEYTRG